MIHPGGNMLMTDEKEKKIMRLYNAGIGVSKIAKALQMKERQVKRVLKKEIERDYVSLFC